MGRQGVRRRTGRNKHENSPVADTNNCSAFAWPNSFLIGSIAIVAITVAAVIAKLYHVNYEDMKQSDLEYEIQDALHLHVEKDQSNKHFIETLQSEVSDLNKELETVRANLETPDKIVKMYHEAQINLQRVIAKKDDEIASLKEEMEINSVTAEKFEYISLQQMYDSNINNALIEKEEVIAELEQIVAEQEKKISVQGKVIENLEDALTDNKETHSDKLQAMKENLKQLTVELVTKSDTIKSLQKQNSKLSANLSSFRDETRQVMINLEYEKKSCFEEAERQHISICEEMASIEEKKRNVEEEKEILENKLFSIESEHKELVSIFQNLENQIPSIFKLQKQDPNKSLEEEINLALAFKDIEAILKERTIEVKEIKLKLEKCRAERVTEIGNAKDCTGYFEEESRKKLSTQQLFQNIIN